ncbi:MAG: poly-gamma-glutamate synthase PgsB [Armatimonadetes bacterium]|nr:poly-gamma-glutamate synthase PgsB [Armatimonadota bacterium]
MELLGAVPALVAFGAALIEARRHRRHLESIPHRIHVNGTRGKSSVVRLVVAGLRAGGLCVVGKTTGSAARVLLPDGGEVDLRGGRRPSLREYHRVAALAASAGADALVVECMAVRPELQRVAERRLMRSTIGVLTGAGLDHLGVMGDSLGEIMEALAYTIPAGGALVVPGSPVPQAWADQAEQRGTRVLPAQLESDLALPCGYLEWPENLAIALEVCQEVGVDRATALAGMVQVRPDPGALRIWHLRPPDDTDGRRNSDLWLVGAFGANDPDSTGQLVARVRRLFDLAGAPTAGILNTRADRGERTLQWCRALLSDEFHVDRLVITGPHARAAARLLAQRGWNRGRVSACADASPADVTRAAAECTTDALLVVGMGNVAGAGAALLAHWAEIGESVTGD